jgi:hypothetical protein
MLTYVAPALELDEQHEEEAGAVTVIGTIAVILVYFATVAAWCWYVCRNNGGVSSCESNWLSAKAVCRN